MTLDDAIVAFGQVASGDFDSIELEVRDYERLVKWLTELKLARESAFSDIELAERAVSENNQLKAENSKLREEFTKMDQWHSDELMAAMDENAKLRELVRDLYGDMWDSGEWLEPYEQRMRELGVTDD